MNKVNHVNPVTVLALVNNSQNTVRTNKLVKATNVSLTPSNLSIQN